MSRDKDSMNKTIAYVDGYNLYYGIIDKRNVMPPGLAPFSEDEPWKDLLWCNLEELINSYKFPSTKLIQIKFFEALSHKPESMRRQQVYINALKSLTIMKGDCIFGGDYKPYTTKCPSCGSEKQYHVEKGTDVQLGVEMVSDILQKNCDSAIVISADSDLVPVYKKVRQIDPEFSIYVIFPPHRSSNEVKNIVGSERTRKISYERLARYQFSETLNVEGFEVKKPVEYVHK